MGDFYNKKSCLARARRQFVASPPCSASNIAGNQANGDGRCLSVASHTENQRFSGAQSFYLVYFNQLAAFLLSPLAFQEQVADSSAGSFLLDF